MANPPKQVVDIKINKKTGKEEAKAIDQQGKDLAKIRLLDKMNQRDIEDFIKSKRKQQNLKL